MPRLNLPKKQVLSAGSTGVQPDIDISSPQFRAISQLGANVEGLADQAFDIKVRTQEHVDRGAASRYSKDNSTFQNDLMLKMNSEGVKYDKEIQDSLSKKSFAERRSSIIDELNKRGASDAQKRRITEDFKAEEKKFNVGLQLKQINESIELANFDLESDAQQDYYNGDFESGNEKIDSMQVSAVVKAKTQEQIKANYDRFRTEVYDGRLTDLESKEGADVLLEELQKEKINPISKEVISERINRKKKSLFRFQERIIKEATESQISLARNSEELDAIRKIKDESGELGDVAKIQLEDTINRRRSSINNTEASELSAQLRASRSAISLINKDLLVSELQLSSAITDEALRSSLVEMINSKGGPKGIESDEFIDLFESLNDATRWDDVNASEKEEINKFIESNENSTESKYLIAGAAMSQQTVDIGDGDLDTFLGVVERNGQMVLEWKDEEIALDSSQKLMISEMGRLTASWFAPAEAGDWRKSPMSPLDAKRLFQMIHSKDLIDKFANKDDASLFKETWDTEIQRKLDSMITNTAMSRYNKRVSEINKQILGNR